MKVYIPLSESGDEEHIQLKKKIEALREEQGAEHWLHSKSAAKVENLIGIKNLNEEILDEVTLQNNENLLFAKVNQYLSNIILVYMVCAIMMA